MLCKSVIDRLIDFAPGWSRSTGNKSILNLIQQGLDDLFDHDGPILHWIGTDNKGYAPYLITADTQYKYSITAANTSATNFTKSYGGTDYTITPNRITKVFIDATNTDYVDTYVGVPYHYQWLNPYAHSTDRVYIADIPVQSEPAYDTEPPKITFLENPGDTTQKYFVEFTFQHPRLTSESIPLFIPNNIAGQGMEDYVLGRISKLQNGAEGHRLQMWEQKWKPLFHKQSRLGPNRRPNQTFARPC